MLMYRESISLQVSEDDDLWCWITRESLVKPSYGWFSLLLQSLAVGHFATNGILAEKFVA
ncbi:hypothetical protein STEG23_026176, partial [Scotinomys teguina]